MDLRRRDATGAGFQNSVIEFFNRKPYMHTEFAAAATAAIANPFAAFLTPELVVAAHERMASRAPGVVHRPLDRPWLAKPGSTASAAFDADLDDEEDDVALDGRSFDEFDADDSSFGQLG